MLRLGSQRRFQMPQCIQLGEYGEDIPIVEKPIRSENAKESSAISKKPIQLQDSTVRSYAKDKLCSITDNIDAADFQLLKILTLVNWVSYSFGYNRMSRASQFCNC